LTLFEICPGAQFDALKAIHARRGAGCNNALDMALWFSCQVTAIPSAFSFFLMSLPGFSLLVSDSAFGPTPNRSPVIPHRTLFSGALQENDAPRWSLIASSLSMLLRACSHPGPCFAHQPSGYAIAFFQFFILRFLQFVPVPFVAAAVLLCQDFQVPHLLIFLLDHFPRAPFPNSFFLRPPLLSLCHATLPSLSSFLVPSSHVPFHI